MKVDYQENFKIEEYNIDVAIPEKKIIVKIFTPHDINFDKFSYTGKAILIKRIYESFTGFKPIFINGSEFFNLNDHMNRINYLISNGLENNNTSGVYDFSQIKLTSRDTEQPAAEVEPAVEEAEKEGEEEDDVVAEVEGEEEKK